jgi:hypothetical protein
MELSGKLETCTIAESGPRPPLFVLLTNQFDKALQVLRVCHPSPWIITIPYLELLSDRNSNCCHNGRMQVNRRLAEPSGVQAAIVSAAQPMQ